MQCSKRKAQGVDVDVLMVRSYRSGAGIVLMQVQRSVAGTIPIVCTERGGLSAGKIAEVQSLKPWCVFKTLAHSRACSGRVQPQYSVSAHSLS